MLLLKERRFYLPDSMEENKTGAFSCPRISAVFFLFIEANTTFVNDHASSISGVHRNSLARCWPEKAEHWVIKCPHAAGKKNAAAYSYYRQKKLAQPRFVLSEWPAQIAINKATFFQQSLYSGFSYLLLDVT